MNDLPETTPLILWETLKAYLRGCIISFQASRRKRNRAELMDLEKPINRLDKDNAIYPSTETHKKNYLAKIQI